MSNEYVIFGYWKTDNPQAMSRKYKITGKIGLFDKQFANEQLT